MHPVVHIYVPITHKPTHVHTYTLLTFVNCGDFLGFSGIFWLFHKIWIGEVFEQLQGKVEKIISLNEHLHIDGKGYNVIIDARRLITGFLAAFLSNRWKSRENRAFLILPENRK